MKEFLLVVLIQLSSLVGVAGNGNAGVASLIKLTPGTIGYLEYGYAKSNALPIATLENKGGKFVAPTPDSSLIVTMRPLAGADISVSTCAPA